MIGHHASLAGVFYSAEIVLPNKIFKPYISQASPAFQLIDGTGRYPLG
jgi:hypothetical protein